MKCLLGKKEYMTQVFDEEGKVHPTTVISVFDGVVTKIKTEESDGYHALQVGFGEQKEERINKPQREEFKDQGSFLYVREFRSEEPIEGFSVGDKVAVQDLEKDMSVSLTGTSKGKGFQGVVKRHNFSGGPRTHGNKHHERMPGSVGSTGPQRVFKGVRMGGRTGGDQVTLKNVKVVQVDPEKNQVYVQGAVPGRKGSLVMIKA